MDIENLYNLLEKKFNPPLIIQDYKVSDSVTVHVIRDDLLIGGTKQRGLFKWILNTNKAEYVYAGPPEGYMQLTLSYISKIFKKKATIFLSGKKSQISLAAEKHGANIFETVNLATAEQSAKDYASLDPNRYLIPFGLDSEDFINILSSELEKSIKGTVLENRNAQITLWSVIGSGTLLKSFGKVWPNAEFMPVRVGASIWEDKFDKNLWERMGKKERIDFLRTVPDDKHNLPKIPGHRYQEFWESTPPDLLPPFPALKTYDAKVWQRVLQYAKNGDFVWIVGKDI